MELASITQFGGALTALAPLLLILGFAFVIWRTVSLHTLLRRLWLLVHGSEEISDPKIRAYVDEQTNLMSFRMFSGVQAASVEEAHQLIAWTQHHRVDLRQIAACGRYFDTGLRQVRKHLLPSSSYLFAQIAFFTLLLMGFIVLMAIPQVPFTFKDSGRTFLANESLAKPLWPLLQPLKTSDCDQSLDAIAERTSFTLDEVKIVCDLLSAKNWPQHVESELKKQRWVLFVYALVSLALLCHVFFVVNAVGRAKDLSARGLSSVLPGEQSPLDF